MLEAGFQAPPDPTVVPFDPHDQAFATPRLLAQTLPPNPGPGAGPGQWIALFPSRPAARFLHPCYAILRAPGRLLVADAKEGELVVVVASGAVDLLTGARRRLHALGAFRLGPGAAVELRAVDVPALLLAVRANPVA
jgi:hypothetical protein